MAFVHSPTPSRRAQLQAQAVAGIGVAVVAVYALVAAMQILVWNVLAAAPGKTLPRIHADMHAAREDPGIISTLIVLGIGVVLAVLTFVWVSIGKITNPWLIVTLYLGLIVLGAAGYLAASFGPGMALADTYGIGGADHTHWGVALLTVSGAALIALIAVPVGVATVRPDRRRDAAHG